MKPHFLTRGRKERVVYSVLKCKLAVTWNKPAHLKVSIVHSVIEHIGGAEVRNLGELR